MMHVVSHIQTECADFTKALKKNIVYLWNGRLHACVTRRPLEVNIGWGGMKRIMEEAAARNAEAIQYSVSAGIRVGGEKGVASGSNTGFWRLVLEGLLGVRLRKEEVNRAERQIQECTEWNDPVEQKTGFAEAAYQNYEVLVEDKWAGKAGGVGHLGRYDTQSEPKRCDGGLADSQEKTRKNFLSFRLSSEIEKTKNLRKVLKERILDSRVELTMREVLAITKKEFHNIIIELVKRKQLSIEPEAEKRSR